MLKFNGEMLTSRQNQARQRVSRSSRLNHAPLREGLAHSGQQAAGTF